MSGYCMSNKPPYGPTYDYTGLYDQKRNVDVTVDGTVFTIIIQSKEKASTEVYKKVLYSAADQMEQVSKTMTDSDDYCSDKEREVAVCVEETFFKIGIQCSSMKTLSTEEYTTALKKAVEEIDRKTQEHTSEGR